MQRQALFLLGSRTDSGFMSRVWDQIVSEIDSLNAEENVFLIGATNRPNTMESEIIRPGK